MEKKLIEMCGKSIPSSTGMVTYLVKEVVPKDHVTLTAQSRKQPAVLKWADIELVFKKAPASGVRTVDVDQVLNNPQFRASSPMCALVLALRNPRLVQD